VLSCVTLTAAEVLWLNTENVNASECIWKATSSVDGRIKTCVPKPICQRWKVAVAEQRWRV